MALWVEQSIGGAGLRSEDYLRRHAAELRTEAETLAERYEVLGSLAHW